MRSDFDTRGDSTFGVDMDDGLLATPTDDVARLPGRPPRTFEDDVVRAAAAGACSR